MKNLFILTMIFAFVLNPQIYVSAQIIEDHSYFKINDEVINTKYDSPNLVTKINGDFIYNQSVNTGENLEIIIDKAALGNRFGDAGLILYTKLRSNFDFTVNSQNNPIYATYPGFTSYTFNTNIFNFSFNNTGTYELSIELYRSNGAAITKENYIISVGPNETASDILINNIIQSQDVIKLQGNETLTFDSNTDANKYTYEWGNNSDIYSLDKSFELNLAGLGRKPDYMVLRTINKETNVFKDSFIYFDYSNSTEYVINPPVEQNQSGYNVSPPEVILDTGSNLTIILSLLGFTFLVSLIAFGMFRFVKSAKINS